MDRDTGEALFARYPTLRRSIASTTKLMTGLIAAESGRLDDMVSVSQNAASVGETTMQAVAGERLTLRDLTYGLMLVSGNDAAVAIAEALDGSVPAFSDHMNRRAHQLGMWDTQFANPHGLDHERFYRPDHFSTARDMAVLGSAIGDSPEIRRIAGTTIYDVPSRDGRPARTLRNTLAGLWWYPGMVAGKTGWTERAGQCRVVIADRGGIRLSVALLGTPDEVRELRDLLDFGFATLESRRSMSMPPMVPRSPDSFGAPAPDVNDAWERFWATLVTSEGMVRTAPGSSVGTSALQGDAMLHAVWMRDREAFERLWEWTRTRLERTLPTSGARPRDALYARRWEGEAVTSWANDVGADQRIAGALLLASRTWREPAFAAAATDTLAAVLEKSAISSNRLGIAFEPTLPTSTQGTVVSSGRSIVPALMRVFAEGARQGVWHWLIDGSYTTLRRITAADTSIRRSAIPGGLWPSTFIVSRQGLAVSDRGDVFGHDAAALIAQLSIEARWRAESGATVPADRDDRAAQMSLAAARAIMGSPGLLSDGLPLGARALLACAVLVESSASDRTDAVRQALTSSDASVVLDGLTGRWCQLGGPPDLWRVYLEPSARPTTRNDAVVPPGGVAPWFHDDETGHVVSGRFATFVASHGGFDLLGPPLTDAFNDSGRRIQLFRNAILEEVAGATGPSIAVVGVGLARAGADGVLTRPEAVAVPAVAPGKRRVGNSGHTIGGAFAKVVDGEPGLGVILGDPITEELEVDGLTVQYFVGGRLEYVPGRVGVAGEPVRLSPVGALMARDRGWLDAKP
jgi:D-alanyl-D-alanine carboxypeptidase